MLTGKACRGCPAAYHRIHHSAAGRLDINLGTVFAVWDVLSRREVFPARPHRHRDRAGRADVLSLVQVVLCLLAALALLVTRHLLVVLGAMALMAGTIASFVLARTVGIFGFHLTFCSGLAYTVLAVEAAGVVMLALTGWLPWQRRAGR